MINMEAMAQSDAALHRQVKIINLVVLAILIAVVIGPFLFQRWFAQQYPAIDTIAIRDVRVVGETALCPGDTLTMTYRFEASGTGVLVRDATVWNVTPPKTMIFSNNRRFILDGATREAITETWTVPQSYLNTETDQQEPLPPGEYRRYVGIAALRPTGVVAIGYATFAVRGDCP